MKKIMITGCVSLLILVMGMGNIALAYTAEVSYFFEGIDLDTGEIYSDPTVLVVFQGEPKDIDEILKPEDFMPGFGSSDLHSAP